MDNARRARGTDVDPGEVAEFLDRGSAIPVGSAFLWPSAMGLRLAALPPSGATIDRDEYARHKPVYFAILRHLESGVDLIENNVVFEHVRVCRMEPGVVDTCDVQ